MDGFVWNGTDCKPKATPSPTAYNVFLHDPERVGRVFGRRVPLPRVRVVVYAIQESRGQARTHPGTLLLLVAVHVGEWHPLLLQCAQWRGHLVRFAASTHAVRQIHDGRRTEGGGGPESLLDDGKSTLAQYYAALIELIQACTWAIGLPLKMAMSRADFLATRYNDFGGGAYGPLWTSSSKKTSASGGWMRGVPSTRTRPILWMLPSSLLLLSLSPTNMLAEALQHL